jgi:peptidoglycan hydrolase-like protein with peptidoglycan-binding domain
MIFTIKSILQTPTTAKAQNPKGRAAPNLPPKYVRALQEALEEWKPGVDLDKEGVYGPKTQQAVEDFAAARKIQNPLDSSGRPTEKVNVALDSFRPVEKPASPPAPPGRHADSAAKRKDNDKPYLFQFTLQGGTNFNFMVFLRALPKGGLTQEDNPPEAILAIRQMRTALSLGGITLTSELPQISALSISTADQHDSYMDSIDKVVEEIIRECQHVADSFLVQVNKRRSQLGMRPVPEPSPHNSREEVYNLEHGYWMAARAGASVAASAHRILAAKMLSFFRGSKHKISTLLRDTAHENSIFSGPPLADGPARRIGEEICSTNTTFAGYIDKQDPLYYYDFNKNIAALAPLVKESLSALGDAKVRGLANRP